MEASASPPRLASHRQAPKFIAISRHYTHTLSLSLFPSLAHTLTTPHHHVQSSCPCQNTPMEARWPHGARNTNAGDAGTHASVPSQHNTDASRAFFIQTSLHSTRAAQSQPPHLHRLTVLLYVTVCFHHNINAVQAQSNVELTMPSLLSVQALSASPSETADSCGEDKNGRRHGCRAARRS